MRSLSWQSALFVLLLSGIILTAFDAARRAVGESQRITQSTSVHTHFPDVFRYVDFDYGFSLAVPAGWHPIIAAESEADERALEPAYAVGFEAPRETLTDSYADYLMVEILPGPVSGNFESSGEFRRFIQIDGLPAIRDKLHLVDQEFAHESLDLVVFQARIQGLGFTVGLYAIGEQHREAIMADAFELMVQTLQLDGNPFLISRHSGGFVESFG